MDSILQYLIPGASAIIVAIIEAIAAKERRARKEEKEEEKRRSNERKEELRLSMKIMDATLMLSVVTANALTGGHNNGNVEEAKKAAQEAQKEYSEFLKRISAEEISGC